MTLTRQLERFQPCNEQEEKDVRLIRAFLHKTPDAFLRSNEMAHMSASSWIVNRDKTKVLMIYHNLYHSWSWTGGHADGEEDLLAVALREAKEETGITSVRPLSEDIFSLEILTVDGHEKRGSYVPSHLHYNITYLLEADEEEPLRIKPDENSDVAWFGLEESCKVCSEPFMVQRVYRKLNEKLEQWKKQ